MFKDRVPSGESYLEDFITKKCKIFEFSKINKIMSFSILFLFRQLFKVMVLSERFRTFASISQPTECVGGQKIKQSVYL